MRKRLVGLMAALLLVLLGSVTSAHAGVLEVYAQAQAGGGYGKGIAGEQKANDFFANVAGGMYGVKVGAEALFIDGWIEHNQYSMLDGIDGTWTQFMLGFDFDFALGDAPQGQQPKGFGQIGLGAGYGVGTGQQVDPPLDAAQVSDKGFLGELELSAEYRLNKVMAIGIELPITYGYMFKNGIANEEANQYQSIHAAGMAYLRFHLGWD